MLATKMMRSTLAQRATAAAVMNRPCLTELITKSVVLWHYDCAAPAAARRAAAPLSSPLTTSGGSVRSCKTRTIKRYFNQNNIISNKNTDLFESGSIADLHNNNTNKGIGLKYQVPQRIRQKVISASDAASLVRDGDTVCVTGFVSQGKCCALCCV
jgi:hypothetical protein